MVTDVMQQGYFSVVRWRSDVTRDEHRNIAVILVQRDGKFGGIRYAPMSTISPRLREQGLLEAMLVGLEGQFTHDVKPDLGTLNKMRESLERSIYITEPEPVAVSDVDSVLNALYRAHVSPRIGGTRTLTKHVLLDRVINTLRHHGLPVQRGDYVGDFLFDIAIRPTTGQPVVLEVLSFAAPRQDWTPVEYNAGHFLYALSRVEASGAGLIKPPSDMSRQNAVSSYGRVRRWFNATGVPTIEPDDLKMPLEVAALVGANGNS